MESSQSLDLETGNVSSVPDAELTFDADETTCAALALNGFSCVRTVEVLAHRRIVGGILVVEVAGHPRTTVRRSVGTIGAGERVAFEVPGLGVPLQLLHGATERRPIEIHARLEDANGGVLAMAEHAMAIAPSTHWPGMSRACESIAAFVTPNSPSLAPVLRDASRRLAEKTGRGALDGTMSRSAERVQRIAEACYEAVAALGISYVVLQASFEQSGQKVRTADDVLRDGLANCLDLSVTLAAVLEAAGLAPMIVLGDGHATVAFATTQEHFPDPVHLGTSRLETRRELGEVRVIEATALCGDPAPFGNALDSGERWLARASDLCRVVDIRACRLVGIHPWPEAMARGAAREDGMVAPPSAPYEIVLPIDLPPLPKPKRSPRAARIEHWQSKLLDLTLRNRLLNDSAGSGLPLAHEGEPAMIALLEVLLAERSLAVRPASSMPTLAGEREMVEELTSGVLRTRLPEDVLFPRATKTYRDARSSLEESGARSLYFGVGFLEFTVEHRPAPVRAPLLLVPASMERISRSEGFRVRMVADDIVPNVALVEYLRATQAKDIGLSAEWVSEAGANGILALLHQVRTAVKDVPGVRVIPAAKVGNYSFKKLPLFEEMRQRGDVLAAHPVVAALLDREAPSEMRDAPLVAPADVARVARFATLRLPLPADSSQTAAVLSATAGRSFVLQGPPGTGKSQTITNLLVASLSQGKRVLFVAEKSAALEVVAERLRRTGLGDFALDLHADNATKTHFTAQVKAALAALDTVSPPVSTEHRVLASELDQVSDRLQAALDSLHAPRGEGTGIFAAIERAWELAESVPTSMDHPALAGRLDGAVPTDANPDVSERIERVERLVAAFAGLASGQGGGLGDFDPADVLGFEESASVGTSAGLALRSLDAYRAAVDALAAVCGVPMAHTLAGSDVLRAVASALEIDHPSTPWLVGIALGAESARALDACDHALRVDQAAVAAAATVDAGYDRSVLDAPIDAWVGDLREVRARNILVRWLAVRRVRSRLIRLSKQPPGNSLPELLDALEQLAGARTAIAAAGPVAERLEGFRFAGRPIDHDAGLRAVAAARTFAELVRRNVPEWSEGLALKLPAAIADGRLATAVGHADAAHGAWTTAVASLDPAVPVPPIDHGAAPFEAARLRLDRLQAGWRDLPSWSTFAVARRSAGALGLAPVAEALLQGTLTSTEAPAAVEAELWLSWVRSRLRAEPELADCGDDRRSALRDRFRIGMERVRRSVPTVVARDVRAAARARLADASVPGMRAAVQQLNQLRVVSTIRRPIRRVLSESAPAMAAIKPLVLASPLTASTLLPPDFPTFDLVVFDEASQVPVWDAACAIVRGAACVIVGDSRQLPPTRFFERKDTGFGEADAMEEAESEDALEPLESVLDEAVASGIPQQSLLWHYRSKDERLIEFSNRRSYGARLKTFPAAHRSHANLGVEFRHVRGVYDRGGSATNQVEAEAVVAEIRRRLLDDDACPANRSLGVVTFGVAQQTKVQDLLDDALDADPVLRARVAETADGEALFVKNLENVQGDERATMLFSVCYGPDANGKVHHQFGPLNLSGGERRLNVAVSRAREKVVVFSSLRSSDLDPGKCTSPGARDLRDYLAFAEHGTVPATRDEGGAPGQVDFGALERRLARRLEDRGFRVDLHVGRSLDYRVSLAVSRPESPDQWILGVEIDGPFHRSAPTVADREVVRPEVMQALGWRIISVGAVDLLRNEDGVVDRILEAISV